jgi:hypothetical protein
MDIEEIKIDGSQKKYCPYFHSRRLKDDVDILFLPYNYILENNNSNSPFNIEIKDAILIFDEVNF